MRWVALEAVETEAAAALAVGVALANRGSTGVWGSTEEGVALACGVALSFQIKL